MSDILHQEIKAFKEKLDLVNSENLIIRNDKICTYRKVKTKKNP